MPTPCIIRFTDADNEDRSHIMRKQHGHPEEVISNLSYLKTIIDGQSGESTVGNIAAQFLHVDILWYTVRDIPLAEIEEEIMALLYSPARADSRDEYSYMHQLAVMDGSTSVEPVSFLYRVELTSEPTDWEVDIGHNSDSISGPVDEVFENVGCGFSGALAEAERQF